MKTLNAYILKNLVLTAAMAFGVLTFGMFSGFFFKALELLYKGVSLLNLCRFLLYMLPEILRFTLPLALLTSTVLVFSRLSADNEIVAMKAVGISIWQIISPGLIFSFLLAVICLMNSLFISPLFRFKSDNMQAQALVSSPVALLQPGTFSTELDKNCAVRVGGIQHGVLYDIHILKHSDDGQTLQDIAAKEGELHSESDDMFSFVLKEVEMTTTVFHKDKSEPEVKFITAQQVTVPLNIQRQKSARTLSRKIKYMDVRMLFARMAMQQINGEHITAYMVDLHTRLALAMSPFSFLLIGLPFAIRSKRSELSIGLLICVLLGLGFYAFLMLGDALEDQHSIHPEFILWIPNIVYQAAGIYFIRRMDRQQ